MPVRGDEALRLHYDDLESRWHIDHHASDYSRLVTAVDNSSEPLHRWFRQKEAFSSGLLRRLIKDAGDPPGDKLSILDPFSGSGTTIVSAALERQDRELTAVGVELNPFLHTLSTAKVAAVRSGARLATELTRSAKSIQRNFDRHLAVDLASASSTLNNERYFATSSRRRLQALFLAVNEVADPEVRAILQVCAASAIESAGNLRRDGRTLRYVPNRKPQDPLERFAEMVRVVGQDCEALGSSWLSETSSIEIRRGDSRNTSLTPGSGGTYDWIVFSPPYPNNIDYTEIYKLENWLIGAWADAEAMQSARHRTIRSHPSVKFTPEYLYEAEEDTKRSVDALISPLLAAVPRDRYEGGRARVIRGYVDDMLNILRRCREVAHAETRLVYVVGNSHHGSSDSGYVIAADLIMAALAELAGWDVREIRVARQLGRRNQGDPLMRESVVELAPTARS